MITTTEYTIHDSSDNPLYGNTALRFSIYTEDQETLIGVDQSSDLNDGRIVLTISQIDDTIEVLKKLKEQCEKLNQIEENKEAS